MKWLKYILLTLVWMTASLPCIHADSVDHHEIHGAGLCAEAASGCHCHSCDDVPCPDKMPGLVSPVQGKAMAPLGTARSTHGSLSPCDPPTKPSPLAARGFLSALLTVQLLI
jgi:hypothetical protein